ncbi:MULTISPECIES: hypothetical protein [Bacillus]|uniref:hypothetical protein n=1 Tax=Bacillus TaxID=1386 RepID=UPI00148350AF|nr:hypothetical protein [Bacillus pseudomycoides]MED1596691.1 hypothetical protein [Bacillus pseudomycoides]MED4712579.1 hypothetical protein [Bacillus pseudomycoides]
METLEVDLFNKELTEAGRNPCFIFVQNQKWSIIKLGYPRGITVGERSFAFVWFSVNLLTSCQRTCELAFYRSYPLCLLYVSC